MKIRFQADADLNQMIVKATVRLERGIDFQTGQAAGLAGLDDPDVLKLAAEQGRVLVSHDRKTMPTHFGQFILAENSAGVLIVKGSFPPFPAPSGKFASCDRCSNSALFWHLREASCPWCSLWFVCGCRPGPTTKGTKNTKALLCVASVLVRLPPYDKCKSLTQRRKDAEERRE